MAKYVYVRVQVSDRFKAHRMLPVRLAAVFNAHEEIGEPDITVDMVEVRETLEIGQTTK